MVFAMKGDIHLAQNQPQDIKVVFPLSEKGFPDCPSPGPLFPLDLFLP